MKHHIDYYDLPTAEVSCDNCGWSGLGAEATLSELFEQLAEYNCPRCLTSILIVPYPTLDETEQAARRGIPEAINGLDGLSAMQDRFADRFARVKASREWVLVVPEALETGEVRCRLELEHIGDGEDWLVLYANGIELHSELAEWENTEPAHRLFAIVSEAFASRLYQFDYHPAMEFLGGDRIASINELKQLVSDLPEPDR